MGSDFKCSMCVFLLAELDNLRSELFDRSIQPYNLNAVGTQTCYESSEIACQSDVVSIDTTCQTEFIRNGNENDDGNTSDLLLSTDSNRDMSSLLLHNNCSFILDGDLFG